MKKVLTLLFLMMGCATLLRAQNKFEIAIIRDSVANVSSAVDTVGMNDTVILYITFQNYGAFPLVVGSYQPDSFPGGTYGFKNNVARVENRSSVAYSKSFTLPPLAYKASCTLQDTIIISDKYYISDTANIIIIWPGGAKVIGTGDSIDTVPYTTYKFYVSSALSNAGIPVSVQNNAFKIYPNPAQENLNIGMKNASSGIIRLMDITGKTILAWPYTAQHGETISLPLNKGNTIPDGLYLLGIQSATGFQVEKVVIGR